MKFVNVVMIFVLFNATNIFTRSILIQQPASTSGTSSSKILSSSKMLQSSDSTSGNTVVDRERKKIEQATLTTEAIKTEATKTINTIREQLLKNTINAVEASKKIGEQKYIIEQAEKKLAELVGKSVEKVEAIDAEKGYMEQLISGAQDIGAYIVAPFKSGYGYTEKEKSIARATIAELQRQRTDISLTYEQEMKKKPSAFVRRDLQNKYNATLQKIADEIYQQQLITGDVMSTNRKLFWAAVGFAGAVIGRTVAQQMSTEEIPATTEVSSTPSLTEAQESWKEKAAKRLEGIGQYFAEKTAGLEQPAEELFESTKEKLEKVAESVNKKSEELVRKINAQKNEAEARKLVGEEAERFAKEAAQEAERKQKRKAAIGEQVREEELRFAQETEAQRQAREKGAEAYAEWSASHPEEEGLINRVKNLFATESQPQPKKYTLTEEDLETLYPAETKGTMDRISEFFSNLFGGTSEPTANKEIQQEKVAAP